VVRVLAEVIAYPIRNLDLKPSQRLGPICFFFIHVYIFQRRIRQS